MRRLGKILLTYGLVSLQVQTTFAARIAEIDPTFEPSSPSLLKNISLDEDLVLDLFQRADQGDAEAQYQFAMIQLNGDSLKDPIDAKEAAKRWLEKASSLGHEPAKQKLDEISASNAGDASSLSPRQSVFPNIMSASEEFLPFVQDPYLSRSHESRRLAFYKRKLGLSQTDSLHLSPRENHYCNEILEGVKTLKSVLISKGSWKEKETYAQRIQARIFENIYDFILHEVREAEALCQQYSHDYPNPRFRKAIEEQQKSIDAYLRRADICGILEKIVRKCPILPKRRPTLSMLVSPQIGPFSDLDIPTLSLGSSLYLKDILALATFLFQPLTDKTAENYILNIDKAFSIISRNLLFTSTVLPLCKLQQFVENIARAENLHEDQNFEYVWKQLYFLGGFIPLAIPYDKQRISPQELPRARKESTHSKPLIQNRAKERLLYARIPWEALQNIYGLIHERRQHDSSMPILFKCLAEIVQEFKVLQGCTQELLDLQTSIIKDSGVPVAPISEQEPPFSAIRTIGSYRADLANLKKMKEAILTGLRQIEGLEFRDDRTYNAFVRILEILGEASKNLSPEFKAIRNPVLWNQLAEIRDMLSHLEQKPVAERFQDLRQSPETYEQIVGVDFVNLLRLLDHQVGVLSLISSWQDIKDYYTPQSLNVMQEAEFGGITSLIDHLVHPLTLNRRKLLETTVQKRDRSTLNVKQEIRTVLIDTRKRFDAPKDKESFFKRVAAVFTKTQLKRLEEIYKHMNSDAPITPEDLEFIQKTLDSRHTYKDEEALHEVRVLIKSIASFTKWPALEKELKKIGIHDSYDLTFWEIQHKDVQEKAQGRAAPAPEFLLQTLNKFMRAVQKVLPILEELERLTPEVRDISSRRGGMGHLIDNPDLYHACEHLMSSYRKQVGIMLSSVDYLKRYEEYDYEALLLHQLLTDFKSTLYHTLGEGNATLHLHDVTEPETLTPAGYRFKMFQDIINLVDGIPYAQGLRRLSSLKDQLVVALKEAEYLASVIRKDKAPSDRNTHLSRHKIYNIHTGWKKIEGTVVGVGQDGTSTVSYSL
jgi:hypothetical protein